MTPNDIEILLHFHVSPCKHPRHDAPAVKESIRKFVDIGLITYKGGEYKLTARGDAHVKQLCNLPLPNQAWVSACGDII